MHLSCGPFGSTTRANVDGLPLGINWITNGKCVYGFKMGNTNDAFGFNMFIRKHM